MTAVTLRAGLVLRLDLSKINDRYLREVLRSLVAYISEIDGTSGGSGVGGGGTNTTITNNVVQRIPLDGSEPISGTILPDADNVHSIGSETLRLAELHASEVFVSGNTLYIGGEPALKNENGTVTLSSGMNKDVAIKARGTGKVIIDTEADVEIITTGNVTVNNALVEIVINYVKETFTTANLNVNGEAVLGNIPRLNSETVALNGLLLEEGAGCDYTITNNVLSLNYTLSSDDTLLVKYSY